MNCEMSLQSTNITVDSRLDENNKEVCLCERNVYSQKRTNKDGSQLWMCLVPRCNCTLTTNRAGIVIKVNGQKLVNNELSQIGRHESHAPLTDSQINQLYGADVFSDENNNTAQNLNEDTMLTIENTFTSMLSLNEYDDDDSEENRIGNILYLLQQNLDEIRSNAGLGSDGGLTYQVAMCDELELANEANYSIALFFENDRAYSKAILERNGVKALIDSDRERFSLLKSASDKLDKEKRLSFYLAHADLVYEYVEGEADDAMEEWLEKERTLSIENIYDTNGAKVFENAIVSVDFFTAMFGSDVNIAKGVEQTDSAVITDQLIDGKRYRTKTYQTFMLIIWPKQFEFENLIQIDYQSAAKLHFKQQRSSKNSYLHNFRRLINELNVNSSYYPELFDKFLDTLFATNDINLTRAFFTKAINCQINNQILIPKLERLLTTLNPVEFQDFIKSTATTNFFNNFHLLARILKLNDKKKASIYYDQKVLPILEKRVEFPFITSNPELYVMLLEILLKLGDPQKTKGLKRFQELVKLNYSQDSLRLLLDVLANKAPKDCKNLSDLFTLRISWLLEKTQKEPVYDYKLKDASFPESKIIEEFLRSSADKLVYSGEFKSISDARQFVARQKELSDELSLKLTARGIGRQSNVLIEKAQSSLVFDREREAYGLLKKELKLLERKVKI